MKEQYLNQADPDPRRGKREAPDDDLEPEEPQRPFLVRLGVAFYKLIVVLAIVIIVLYFAWPYLVPEPNIGTSDPPVIPVSDGSADTPDTQLGAGMERRDQVYNILLLGRDVQSGNTDSIIVVRYDVPQQKVGMISIPRDTAVKRSWSSYPKINGAFFGAGADTLKQEIYYTFGIPIDYYILVDLKGFIALVDELGGVDVDIPVNMDYDDPTPGMELHIHFKKGPQHLDGQAAMEAVRFRHGNGNADSSQDYSDVGRAAFQRQVLMSLARKVVSWNSVSKVKNFVDLFHSYVDTDLSTTDMLWFASHALQVDLESSVTQGTLEGRGDAVYQGAKWCFVFDADTILPVLNEQVNPFTEPLTAENLHLVRADSYLY